MPKTEVELVEEMCWLIHDWEKDAPLPLESRVCKTLASALYSAKSTLERGSPRRVFIQELAASLNRKRILPSERYDKFNELGFEYMEASI